MRVDLLDPYLKAHPDQTYAAYIADGLKNGFQIGFQRGGIQLKSRGTNHPSCRANPGAVQERLMAELRAGRLFGPVTHTQCPRPHVSPMGLVPKARQPNKFRLIVDLSCPSNKSVNDGIPSYFCSLRYASIDDAVAKIRALGCRTMLLKIDLKDAYRIVPVHPSDYHLLGVSWEGNVFIDRALPFGLRSAPKIFNAVADFIAWVLHMHGVAHQLHYLDDFLFFGAPYSDEAARALEIVTRVLHMLGITIATHKTEGPATSVVFLGIVLDTLRQELRLPEEKLTRLRDLLQTWSTWTFCNRRDLESLLGHLSHAATVVRHGRTFLRELFPLLRRTRKDHHFIHLTAGARADLTWWHLFVQDWNGISFFPQATPSVEVTSDASGSFGCGAVSPSHGWFQLQWPETWSSANIAAKELVPIVIAAAIWGPCWQQKCVCFRTDNMAVVDVVTSRTAKDPLLVHLIRCLVFYAAFYHFDFMAKHIPGTHNLAADALSRDNLALFLSLTPQIPQFTVPQPMLDLLVEIRPNWGSQAWTDLFRNSLTRGSPSPQDWSMSVAGVATPGSAANSPTPHSPSPSTSYANLQQ